MSVFVKICGMTSADEAGAVSELEPDALGFIFWPKSRRFVPPAMVGDWETAPGVLRVGVFVDATPDSVAQAVVEARLDVVQLHGREDPRDYAGAGAALWKALHLGGGPTAEMPDGRGLQAFLLDSRIQEIPGGTGQTCDWQAAADFVRACPRSVLLAGGLAPHNAAAAIMQVQPWGLDVSSGVETASGTKDLKLVEEFIEQCRRIK
jgi:phosphoribosylanthranilate isomerase